MFSRKAKIDENLAHRERILQIFQLFFFWAPNRESKWKGAKMFNIKVGSGTYEKPVIPKGPLSSMGRARSLVLFSVMEPRERYCIFCDHVLPWCCATNYFNQEANKAIFLNFPFVQRHGKQMLILSWSKQKKDVFPLGPLLLK